MSNIDIITQITNNDISKMHASYLKEISEKFKSKKHNISWRYVSSGETTGILPGYEKITTTRICSTPGRSHVAALSESLKYISKSTDIVIFCDSDIVILYKNWDDVIADILNKYDCCGPIFPRKSNRYQTFPSIFLFCIRRDVMEKCNIDFRRRCRRLVKDKKTELLYGIEIGKMLTGDTGARLPEIFAKNNLSNFLIKEYRESPNLLKCLRQNNGMVEWLYERKIFMIHLGDGGHRTAAEIDCWHKEINTYVDNMQVIEKRINKTISQKSQYILTPRCHERKNK